MIHCNSAGVPGQRTIIARVNKTDYSNLIQSVAQTSLEYDPAAEYPTIDNGIGITNSG
ncbi:hypothetical protein [Chitinophaga sp. 212800010-3]|uniref:hypothetical protein n=1 Tax=unclassified Chitinophaga TaxID=2619133 RepID=UPI002E0F8365